MHQHKVKFKPIQTQTNGDLAEIIYYECQFCQKTVGLHPDQRRLCEKLSGKNFYCSFCLQNNLHCKNNRHILVMTFKGIIGFYYNVLYLTNKELYQSQIMDYIEMHRCAGLQNPVFRYDPESLLWFIDFSKVGRGRKKIPLKEVLKTTVNILACFELPRRIERVCTSKVYEKYHDAITKFYTDRYRPRNRKILAPTLMNCGGQCDNKNFNHEDMRNFKKLTLY